MSDRVQKWLARCFAGMILLFAPVLLQAQYQPFAGQSSAFTVPSGDLMAPQVLNAMLQKTGNKPFLLFQVGSRMMYMQAHIPH